MNSVQEGSVHLEHNAKNENQSLKEQEVMEKTDKEESK
jgi:hypothetical protein